MVIKRTIAVTVAFLMVLSMVAVVALVTAPKAEAGTSELEYDYEEFPDPDDNPQTPETGYGEDGSTRVFLKAWGQVGITSQGVGLRPATIWDYGKPLDPRQIDMRKNGNPDNTYKPIPEDAEIIRAFLYWAGDFGTNNNEIPLRNQAPEGSDEMIFEGEKFDGVEEVDYIGYEHMDYINHRRVYRAEVTHLIPDTGYNKKYSVQPTTTPEHCGLVGLDQWREWWGASLVVVYAHASITNTDDPLLETADVCIANGANIMDIPPDEGSLPGEYPDPWHIQPYTASDFHSSPTLPSSYKGVICSDGGMDDIVSYKFTANGSGPPEPYFEEEISDDDDGSSWDDETYNIQDNVAEDTTEYTVDMWNADGEWNNPGGAYCDLYVDWFWFGAMIDLQLEKRVDLILDADTNGKVSPGDTLRYTLTFWNAGDTRTPGSTTMVDDYDESKIESVSAISNEGQKKTFMENDYIEWDTGQLESDSEQQTRTYEVTLKGASAWDYGPTELNNYAEISDDVLKAVATASHTEIVTRDFITTPKPRFDLRKDAELANDADGDGTVSPGDTLKYTLRYRNTTNSSPSSVVLTDDFDQTYVSGVSAVSGNGSSDGDKIVWDIGTLKKSSDFASQTYLVTLKSEAAFPEGETKIVNTAVLKDTATGKSDDATHTEVARKVGAEPEKTFGARKWYLAEGSTGSDWRGGFQTWVLVQNAGEEPADIQITYNTPDGERPGPARTLDPGTRQTFNVADNVPDEWSVSAVVDSDEPVIAERAMYWDGSDGTYRRAAHDSVGVTDTATTWYLAEGSTGGDQNGSFQTWVLVQNPGDTAANVQLSYMTPDGTVPGHSAILDPGTRQTFDVSEIVPNNWSVSTMVSSDQPIIAERAMYWDTASGVYRQAAHDSIGVTGAADEWYLAEGSTGADDRGGFQTWVLLQNPGNSAANVQLTYMTPAGSIPGPTDTLDPGTRQTYNVADTVAGNWSVSTAVNSDQPIIAERAMYWDAPGVYRRAAHDSIGVTPTAGASGMYWFLAEGSTGAEARGSFQTWILVQNAGTESADIQITYMTPDGSIPGPTDTLDPGTRQTYNVADTISGEWSVSTMVTSDQPVFAERAMYWDAPTVYRQAAHDSIGFDP